MYLVWWSKEAEKGWVDYTWLYIPLLFEKYFLCCQLDQGKNILNAFTQKVRPSHREKKHIYLSIKTSSTINFYFFHSKILEKKLILNLKAFSKIDFHSFPFEFNCLLLVKHTFLSTFVWKMKSEIKTNKICFPFF